MKNNLRCEDLRKSKANSILNTLLLLLIGGSYVPQICLILNRRSTSGINPSYIVFKYLFTTTQFGMVLLYSSPILGCIADRRLGGLDAHGHSWLDPDDCPLDWLNFIVRLTLFFLYPNQIHVDTGANESPFAINSTTPTERRRYPRTVPSLCILHTCIWVLPVMAISIPRPRMGLMFSPKNIFIGICDFYLIPACIVLVICMFPLQIREIISLKRPIHESSLSPATLALQTIAFMLLGSSWKNRVGQPGDPSKIIPPDLTQPRALYRLGAWKWVNHMIFGVGQGLLLLISLWVRSQQWTSRGRTQGVNETTALL